MEEIRRHKVEVRAKNRKEYDQRPNLFIPIQGRKAIQRARQRLRYPVESFLSLGVYLIYFLISISLASSKVNWHTDPGGTSRETLHSIGRSFVSQRLIHRFVEAK
jgi:hypothetical protein